MNELSHSSAPRGRAVSIGTRDGWTLAASLHGSAPDVGGDVAIVMSAIGASRHRYAPFAAHLARAGWTVVTFDYRGIGDSREHRRHAPEPTLIAWGEQDLRAVIEWADRELRPTRIIAVAHSIGGQLLALAPNHHRLAKVVAVSTPRPFWRLWSGPYRHVVHLFFWLMIPAVVALLGRLPMRLARLHDLPGGVARDWAHTSLHLDSALDEPNPRADDERYRRQREGFARYRTPTLVLSFADDHYIAPRPTVDLLVSTFYAHAPCVRLHVEPAAHGIASIGHSGFFDGHVPVSWWDHVLAWLEEDGDPTALDSLVT